jgi:hypothetical protein
LTVKVSIRSADTSFERTVGGGFFYLETAAVFYAPSLARSVLASRRPGPIYRPCPLRRVLRDAIAILLRRM